MNDQTVIDMQALAALAAMLDGDRALTLDGAALLLGMKPGTFRQVAAKPGFPKAARMGKRLTWRRVELLEWWKAEQKRQNAA